MLNECLATEKKKINKLLRQNTDVLRNAEVQAVIDKGAGIQSLMPLHTLSESNHLKRKLSC